MADKIFDQLCHDQEVFDGVYEDELEEKNGGRTDSNS